jgi:hypothetical protein
VAPRVLVHGLRVQGVHSVRVQCVNGVQGVCMCTYVYVQHVYVLHL